MRKYGMAMLCAALLAACAEDPLAGKDQDGNGVRDDIDAHIAQKYDDNPPLAAATRQIAQVFQTIVLLPPPEDESAEALDPARAAHRQAAKQIRQTKMRARHCIRTLVGSKDDWNTQQEIHRLTFNTEAREKKYAIYRKSLEASIVSLPRKEEATACD